MIALNSWSETRYAFFRSILGTVHGKPGVLASISRIATVISVRSIFAETEVRFQPLETFRVAADMEDAIKPFDMRALSKFHESTFRSICLRPADRITVV